MRITDGQTIGNIRFLEDGEVGKKKSSGILLKVSLKNMHNSYFPSNSLCLLCNISIFTNIYDH